MGRIHNTMILLLSTWMILGAASFYTIGLSMPVRWAIIAVGIAITAGINRRLPPTSTTPVSELSEPIHWQRAALLALPAAIAIVLAWANATQESIRTPWWVLPWWWVLFPLLFAIVSIATRPTQRPLRLLLSALLMLLLASVLAIIYRMGFGFDVHIHQRTLEIINATGVVSPRPPYYAGAYAIILTLNTLFPFLSIWIILRFLVPAFATILIPFLLVGSSGAKRYFFTPMLFTLFAGGWIAENTPQALALLWCVLSVWTARAPDRFSKCTAIAGAAATLSIHPLTGIPTVATVAMMLLPNQRRGWFVGTITSALLPIAFVATLWQGQAPIHWTMPTLPAMHGIAQEGNAPLDVLFSLLWNRWILVVLAIMLILYKNGFKNGWRDCPPTERTLLGGIGLTLVNAAVFAGFSQLPNVISYETTDFAARVAATALVMALPLLLPWGNGLLNAIAASASRISLVGFMSVLELTIGIRVYSIYPIDVDGYDVQKGYSVSKSDLRAVETIADDAGTTPYIVLANQSVSAAAVHRYGFARYYPIQGRSAIFYYPIPTGDALYQYYLRFVYGDPEATTATVRDAMKFAGVTRAYVVINHYWKNAKQIIASGQREADHVQRIDNGVVTVLRYDAD
ncbi:hypothetical protein HZA86_04430 [Candidatus Uhrbacteria bacterium]|nr:hypothetical protein [Candidatus Uhrbacteria bacterium]